MASQMVTWLRQEFVPNRLLVSLMTGFVVGLVSTIPAISFGVLIFAGNLSQYAPIGIGFALFSAIVMGIIVGLGTSLPGVLAAPQDNTAAILALLAASISGNMLTARPEARFMTVAAGIVIASFLTGGLLLTLGAFKLGDLIRFVPYPVIGGVLAGTGWLLVRGAVSVMTGMTLSVAALPELFQPQFVMLWAPGLVFALLLLFIVRRHHHFLILPGLTLLAAVGFYIGLRVFNVSTETALAQGFLLGPFSDRGAWQPFNFGMLNLVDWTVLVGETGKLVTIAVLSAVSLLLNATSLELAAKRDVDLNRELVVAGIANLVASIGGGLVGYHALSYSMLARRMSRPSRLIGVFVAALCAGVLLLGTSILTLAPKPVLGGLLLFLGLSLLVEWLYDAFFKLPRGDYYIVLLILLCIASIGFLEGVAVGTVVTVILFVAKYSRANIVKYALSGSEYHSNVDRPANHLRALAENGSELYLLKLQGYIFFGTAHRLFDLIRTRLHDPALVRYVILDFQLVTGVDSSALLSLEKIRQLTGEHDILLLFSGIDSKMLRQIAGKSGDVDSAPHVFPDLDHAVEWCENQILMNLGVTRDLKRLTLEMQIANALPRSFVPADLMRYFESQSLAAGDYLIHQGDVSTDLYFLESGQVTAQLEFPNGKKVRLRTIAAGTMVGEMGMYLHRPRSASVVAEQNSIVFRLSADVIAQMEQQSPSAAAGLHRFLAQMLAQRLMYADEALQVLLE